MSWVYYRGKSPFSLVGVSVCAAYTHTLTTVACIYFFWIQQGFFFNLLPVFFTFTLIAGVCTGIIGNFITKQLAERQVVFKQKNFESNYIPSYKGIKHLKCISFPNLENNFYFFRVKKPFTTLKIQEIASVKKSQKEKNKTTILSELLKFLSYRNMVIESNRIPPHYNLQLPKEVPQPFLKSSLSCMHLNRGNEPLNKQMAWCFLANDREH